MLFAYFAFIKNSDLMWTQYVFHYSCYVQLKMVTLSMAKVSYNEVSVYAGDPNQEPTFQALDCAAFFPVLQ